MSVVVDLTDEPFDLLLDRNPLSAGFMGLPGYDDRLTGHSAAAARRFAAALALLRGVGPRQ